MRVSILDDNFYTLRKLECFAKLDGHEVTVFIDHVEDVDAVIGAITDTMVSFSGEEVRPKHLGSAP